MDALDNKDYLEIINFRHACKIFDENKKIRKADFEFILEAGRLSPSSLGLEQWDFLVVQNKALREKIKEKSWGQPQITTCSHLVVVLAKIAELKSGSEYIDKMIDRLAFSSEQDRMAKEEFYKTRLHQKLQNNDEIIFQWSHEQCLFAALNMMNAAASIGIDSCPMEGFERDEVGKILGIDPFKHRVAIIVPFGYRLNPQPPKYRREMSDVVKWID
ncbi:NAD(P)H-dependent oxidoreductase [Campylobacter sp. MOP51]|uniref:NAD(P)H-dependent oxidoreductase n=1 Tax=Campylobacter canis TaxID=3378588 RepID=UPI003C62BB66